MCTKKKSQIQKHIHSWWHENSCLLKTKKTKTQTEVGDANQDENQSQEIILLQLLIFCSVLIGLLSVQKHWKPSWSSVMTYPLRTKLAQYAIIVLQTLSSSFVMLPVERTSGVYNSNACWLLIFNVWKYLSKNKRNSFRYVSTLQKTYQWFLSDHSRSIHRTWSQRHPHDLPSQN